MSLNYTVSTARGVEAKFNDMDDAIEFAQNKSKKNHNWTYWVTGAPPEPQGIAVARFVKGKDHI